MQTALLELHTPRILWDQSLIGPADSTLLKIAAADTPAEFAPGTFLTLGSNGYVPVASAGAAASHIIANIMTDEGELADFQYVSATDGAASDHLVTAYPLDGIVFEIMEDALVTPITDANANGYADIVVGAIRNTDGSKKIFGKAQPSILINSDTVNAAADGLLVKLRGVAPIGDQKPYSATAGASPRIFRASIIPTAIG